MSSMPDLAPGTVIAGKYRIDRVLGEGGMGIVVKATHTLLEESVALKFLHPEQADKPLSAKRFLREAKTAMRIRSEHVAQVLDADQLEGGVPFLVMEYLEGYDLSEAVGSNDLLTLEEAVDVILQTCVALEAAHQAGVVHRDIKPANLFRTVGPDGKPLIKILDFGISKLSGDSVESLTKTTTTMGSAHYMSPEQLQSSRDVDHRTDIYALGVTLYELLAKRPPFDAPTMPQLVAAVLSGTHEPLGRWRADVPVELSDVVERAMAPDAGSRFASVRDFADALRPFGRRVADQGEDAAPHLGVAASSASLAPTSAMEGLPDGIPLGTRGGSGPFPTPHGTSLAHEISQETMAGSTLTAAGLPARRPAWTWLLFAGVALIGFVAAVALWPAALEPATGASPPIPSVPSSSSASPAALAPSASAERARPAPSADGAPPEAPASSKPPPPKPSPRGRRTSPPPVKPPPAARPDPEPKTKPPPVRPKPPKSAPAKPPGRDIFESYH